jgi:predicted nuclease of predicted toxin-antitoxin system
MRIKLDENLPVGLVDVLRHLGHDVDTTHDERLDGLPDRHVWESAQRARRFLVTQDLDFSDARRYVPGTHCGLLLVRMGEPGRDALLLRVRDIFQSEAVESWDGCIVVATEIKIRIRRLAAPPI